MNDAGTIMTGRRSSEYTRDTVFRRWNGKYSLAVRAAAHTYGRGFPVLLPAGDTSVPANYDA